MRNDYESLTHTKWRCQYHIVITPKYRRQIIYGKYKVEIGKILRTLCERYDVEIIEANACVDHIHMLVAIPPKMAVSRFMGILKGKSALFGASSPTPASFTDATDVGLLAFYLCGDLSSAVFPKATNIGQQAFLNCEKPVSISLPAATHLGANAFANCTALETLSLPANPPSVGQDPFAGTRPTNRYLKLVNTNGVELAGADLNNAIANYKADAGYDPATGLWYGWTLPASKLQTPTNLAWDGTTPGKATWGAVTGAGSYSVQLYQGSTLLGTFTVTDPAYDFTSAIMTAGTGSYTFKVTAISNSPAYVDSDESAASAAYVYTAGALPNS